MAEKTIVLFCGLGMSTSSMVRKMQKAAEAQGKDYSIAAYALSEEALYAPSADAVLIGPQVRYELENMRKRNPGTPVADIPMRTYGLMDGEGALALAEEIMKK
jgi:PTS system cellobiose-specific IIB component